MGDKPLFFEPFERIDDIVEHLFGLSVIVRLIASVLLFELQCDLNETQTVVCDRDLIKVRGF